MIDASCDEDIVRAVVARVRAAIRRLRGEVERGNSVKDDARVDKHARVLVERNALRQGNMIVEC